MEKAVKDRLYSQTELAKKMNVSQATVTRIIRENGVKPIRVEGRKKLYFSNQLEKLHLSSFERKKDTNETIDSNDFLIFLQKEIKRLYEENEALTERYIEQLRSKDKQIDDLNERLSEAHKLQLGLERQLKMIPEATQEFQNYESNVAEKIKKAPKRSFWSKFFK